jgi:predicted lipoprotein with Yx(FWY)xxD motif
MKTPLILAAALFSALPVYAQSVAERNGLLTDAAGRTLYVFDKDAAGKSNCNGPCAGLWPPLAAPDGAAAKGEYSVVTRDDGGKQWAYQGKPLYYFHSDAKAGDALGDGVKGVWHVVRMKAAGAASPAPSYGNPSY